MGKLKGLVLAFYMMYPLYMDPDTEAMKQLGMLPLLLKLVQVRLYPDKLVLLVMALILDRSRGRVPSKSPANINDSFFLIK